MSGAHQHTSIASVFDSICFEWGDSDAIVTWDGVAIGYSELQQSSIALACQLLYRYRPNYILLELRGNAAAEAVSMLACNRIGVPFVPVSLLDSRLPMIVSALVNSQPDAHLVAVVRCDDDSDPILSHFQRVDVHNVVFVNETGELLEAMNVPQSLPSHVSSDDLYVLFTSGASGNLPKAVIGSQSSTLSRLNWFAKTFPPKQGTIVARRSKLTFVDSITEMFSSLLFPPTVLYAFLPEELDSRGVELICDSPCTQVTMLPSQLEQLLLLSPQKHSLQTVIVSGEPCKACILSRFQQTYPSTRLINLYGQTESTGDVLCAVLSEMDHPVIDNVVAVGRPILPDITVTLTEHKELVIEGNLSNGYLDPKGPLLSFRTGDVGFCVDGVWYVKGRVDDVIKIHGQFVSPVQVETAFYDVFSERCAAVIVDTTVYALVETDNFVFCRERMRTAGIPWHVIPKRVFCVSRIPKQGGGAGKVDRARVQRLALEFLETTTNISDNDDPLVSILSSVLGVTVEQDKSFVEMGGDSALAITLLYKLQVAGHVSIDVTAADILESRNVKDIRTAVSGQVRPKRRKTQRDVIVEQFVARDIKRFSDHHVAVDFKACVDASPLVHGMDVYGACQGGVIQRIANDEVVGCHQLQGWKIQAGMIIVNDSLLVCGYNSDSDNGIVVALTLDLKLIKWTRHVKGQIKSTPITMGDQLWIVAGAKLIILNTVGGNEISTLQLPSKTEARPGVVICRGLPCVVYGFADWDAGFGIVHESGTLITTVHADNVSPVYADLLSLDSNKVAVCDIAGVMHCVNVDSLEIKSTKVASKPIFSGPIQVDDTLIFGCHDGIVRCVKASNFSEKLWEYDAQSVVYSSLLAISGNSLVVCTTAGDVIQIRHGTEESRTIVPGEIWSNPLMTGVVGVIAVGARDSRVHIIRL